MDPLRIGLKMQHFLEHSHFKGGDSFEDHSSEEMAMAESKNAARLQLIKERIETGFYFKDEIDEDISEKLGKILDSYE